MLTRRRFLIAGTSTFAACSLCAQTKGAVPTILDHILLGSRDLDEGVAVVEARTGVRAAFGGVHPGRGTQNALLSLGDRHYLEIIAPDPKQAGKVTPMVRADLLSHLRSLSEPRLVGWAAHPGNLDVLAEQLRKAGMSFHGPTPGSRQRPDGRLLEWKTLHLDNDESGLLPFFIDWSADSPHPASDAPTGCLLEHFELVSPDPAALKHTAALVSVVIQGEKRRICAAFRGPAGRFEATS